MNRRTEVLQEPVESQSLELERAESEKGYRIPRQANDEALRLVQQVFFSPQQAAGLVVFAGMDHGNVAAKSVCRSHKYWPQTHCDRYAWLKPTFARLSHRVYTLRRMAAALQMRSFVEDRSAPFANLSTPPAISGRSPVEQ